MKTYIVVSKKDLASLNIYEHLKDLNDFNFVFSDYDVLELRDIPKDGDLYVVLSRHSSQKKIKSLTLHSLGNFGKAEFGGKNKILVPTNAFVIKNIFLNLKPFDDFVKSLEVTHHGPYFEKQMIFVEIGSTEEDWKNEKAGEVVARAVDLGLKENKEWISAIGFGNPHYAPEFTKLEENSKLAFGHICAKYNLKFLNEDLIKQMVEKTFPKPKIAVLDWKNLKDKKNLIVETLENLGIEWIKLKDAKENFKKK